MAARNYKDRDTHSSICAACRNRITCQQHDQKHRRQNLVANGADLLRRDQFGPDPRVMLMHGDRETRAEN